VEEKDFNLSQKKGGGRAGAQSTKRRRRKKRQPVRVLEDSHHLTETPLNRSLRNEESANGWGEGGGTRKTTL